MSTVYRKESLLFPSNLCQIVLGHEYNIPSFVDLNYFRLLDVVQPILNIKGFLLLTCPFLTLALPLRISGVLSISPLIFKAFFHAEYLISNMFMVKRNRNPGQGMTTCSAYNWKINLMVCICWNGERRLEFLTENWLPVYFISCKSISAGFQRVVDVIYGWHKQQIQG